MIDVHKRDLIQDMNNVAQVLERKAEAVRSQARRLEAAFADDSIRGNPHRNEILASVTETVTREVVGEVVHCSNVHLQGVTQGGIRLAIALTTASWADQS